jgi:hypothetical protein
MRLYWFLVGVAIAALIVLLAGCSGMPACAWHPVDAKELADRCNDWSTNLRGCQTGSDRCDLWVLK